MKNTRHPLQRSAATESVLIHAAPADSAPGTPVHRSAVPQCAGLPPWARALALIDLIRSRELCSSESRRAWAGLLLSLEGRLAPAPRAALELVRLAGEVQPSGLDPALTELLPGLRLLEAEGRMALLRQRLRSFERRWCDTGSLVPEFLRLKFIAFGRSGVRARRALEQELLLRGQQPENWSYHRARWLYRELQRDRLGRVGDAAQAAGRAAGAGIRFHPGQLGQSAAWRWQDLRRLLETMPAGGPLGLLHAALQPGISEFLLPAGAWALMRGLFAGILGGSGTDFIELPAVCWPCPLPDCGERHTLVLHLENGARCLKSPGAVALSDLTESGWKIILVNSGRPLGGLASQVVDPGIKPESLGGARTVLPTEGGSILPLREFVRRVELRYINDVLQLHAGVKTRACESLRITRQTLYTKLSGPGNRGE